MLTTLYITKINQVKILFTKGKVKPVVYNGTKMGEQDFLKYSAIADELLKNKNQ